MARKILCFITGVAAGIALCLATASMLPDDSIDFSGFER